MITNTLTARHQSNNSAALLAAVKHNLIDTVARLLHNNDSVVTEGAVDPCLQGGKTAMIIAAEQGHTEIMRLLLRHHGNVHDVCSIGMTVRTRFL